MVLLHGFTNDWQVWRPVLPALEQHFAVFAPTLPGHFGAAPWEETAPLSISAIADRLERQLDTHGIAEAHFVGNSLGGWLSLELALRGRATSVTCLCPAGGWEPGSAEERAAYRYFWRTTRLALPLSRPLFPLLAGQRWLRAIAMRDMVVHPARMEPSLALSTMKAAANCGVSRQMLATSKKENLFGELGNIECRVTVATADGDRLFKGPTYFSKLRRLLPDAEWIRLEGVGHLPMSDDPDRVAEVIRSGARAAPSGLENEGTENQRVRRNIS
jgi:pimeloyl-ACP methyl ester carboxylesterase